MKGLNPVWKMEQLADVCEVNPRDPGPSDRSNAVSFIPMPAVSEHAGEILTHEARPFSHIAKGYTRFREGDVIFAKITPCMENGKIAVASGLRNGFACGSTEFHVLRPNADILAKYLWFYLRQKSFRIDAERHMTGAVGQRRVPTEYIRKTMIPVPPMPEQRRILRKLDSLFASSKTAREELASIPHLVARYRQAVIASAFKGELTLDWRTENNVSLDRDWSKSSLGKISINFRYGTSSKCHKEPTATPVLRIPNVVKGCIDTHDLKYASFTENERQKLALRSGDILVIRSNGSLNLVGRAARVTNEIAGYLFAGYLIRIRLDLEQVAPSFIQLAFEEPSIRRKIEKLAKSTSGVNNINSEQLKALRLPIPPVSEQQEIVRRVDNAFTHLDQSADQAARATDLIERLEQATLAKAFRGELLMDNQVSAAEFAVSE